MSRLSGLQHDVLSLYRRILREAMKKDRLDQEQRRVTRSIDSDNTSNFAGNKSNCLSFLELRQQISPKISTTPSDPTIPSTTTAYAIAEFRKQASSVQRSDFKKIDYMIRKGDKQIKLLRMPGVKLVSSTATTSINH